jgi:sugar (pentulose or hexulose) kinase
LGGLSTSGGSIEWLRGLLGEPPLTYAEIDALLSTLDRMPGSILYFPYLAGSGSPHTNTAVRAAFIGLSSAHTRADLLKAVLEGTALEIEVSRRAAEEATGLPIQLIIAAGGGTRNRRWIQIKADVSGCRYLVPSMPETTLLGAALLAGVGAGVFASEEQALAMTSQSRGKTFRPDEQINHAYRRIFEHGFLALQEPLRKYFGDR